ncbi:MAG: hypothetical protein FXF47_06260 [Candidatus Mcinerneyibacterium aminivorans]|uniref:Uncharacterized protein n=1 Tax=Candidatus Mcinerneyibacterium aminivorans TaxID=2703815 RepID=A0A5D0MB77_9BACT|nr:MAG: hypothetical protein FXF47_06260 [Candidatus Mcinerneyibacterium aminivorans]
MKNGKLQNIFYEPVFESVNENINYSLLYADILNKINKKFEIDDLIFHNFYFLNKDNEDKLKEFTDDYKILFDQDFALTKSFNKKINNLYVIMEENEDINIHQGYLKQYFCSNCGSFLNKYDYYTKQEEIFVHSVKLNVEKMVKPLVINVTDLTDIIRASSFGLKGSDFSNRKAILPILGKRVPVFQVDNLNRPEVFVEDFEYEKQKLNSKLDKTHDLIDTYRENPNKLEKDLKINGAYEQKIKENIETKYCKKCNQKVRKKLIKSYYVDFNELGQNYNLKTKNYILPLNQSDEDDYKKNTVIEVHNCSICDYYTFTPAEICPKCGNDLKTENVSVGNEILKYVIPFYLEGIIKYYLLRREKKDLIEDINKILSRVLNTELEIKNFVYLSGSLNFKRSQTNFDNIFKKMHLIAKTSFKSESINGMKSKLDKIEKFYYVWGKLFKRDLKQKLEELDLRTDFYIEKYITTILQKLILNQKKASEKGNLITYIDNLYRTIQKANSNIYQYLNNIDLELDVYTYRVAYYFYKELILFISPFLLDYHNYPLKFPSYREDYNYEDELDEEKFIRKFIKKVTEGKNILKVGNEKEIVVWVKTENNVLMETLKINSKYLINFLNINNIKVYDEKEMPNKRLALKSDDFVIYLPIFDLGRIRNNIQYFKKELEDLKVKIIRNRLKLFDFDFLNKAPGNVIKRKREEIKNFLTKKNQLDKYIEILEEIVGNEEGVNEKRNL